MSTAYVKASPRQLVASFTSTLGVGSSYIASVIETSNFKTFVGIMDVNSSNVVVRFRQGATAATSAAMDVSSTIAVPAGTGTLDWTAYGQYGEFGISTVNSTQGEILRFHVYGVPI